MTKQAVILAGGRATRLGPLAAQLNKSLVTVGQQPMLIRQVQQLRRAGVEKFVVVASQGSREQVESVIARSGLQHVTVTTQDKPRGPADAVLASMHVAAGVPTVVLMADTLLDDNDVAKIVRTSDAVLVAPAPSERSFCAPYGEVDDLGISTSKYRWHDGHVRQGATVAVGAFNFSNLEHLGFAAVGLESDGGEVGMALLLNGYSEWHELQPVAALSWQDVGDVPALAAAQRKRFIKRDFHSLIVTEPGVLRKHGRGSDFEEEAMRMIAPPKKVAHLFPRAWDWQPEKPKHSHKREGRYVAEEHGTHSASYKMEHVDLPTLAELWLYWPSVPDMWEHVSRELISQLEKLWLVADGPATTKLPRVEEEDPARPYDEQEMTERSSRMWFEKLRVRYDPNLDLSLVVPPLSDKKLRINGEEVMGGYELVEKVATKAYNEFVETSPVWAGQLHGDPNFTNVLWSLRMGSFKLLDPRGRWGGAGAHGDVRYDLGKIAYSPTFAAITHGLFNLERFGDGWRLGILPKRDSEHARFMRPIVDRVGGTQTRLLIAHMLLSGAPLHGPEEASAMFLAGAQHAQKLVEMGEL